MDLQARDAPSAANHNGPANGGDSKGNGGPKSVEHDLIAGSAPEYGDDRRDGGLDESDITDTDEDDLMNAEFSSTSPSIDNGACLTWTIR